MTRADLHRLVDALPDISVDAAVQLLKRAQDPMLAVLDAASVDDEPLTPDDVTEIEMARAAYRQGEGIPLNELTAEPRS